MISPDQGATVPVSVIGQQDTKLTLLVMVGVGGEYRAEINKDGTELNGTWSQSGGDFPLTLMKSHAHEKP